MSKDRKTLIIEAAKKSFTQFGYKATTMDLVAKLANVGKGTIYTFFKNKEELFGEIFSSLLIEMKQTADHAIDPGQPFHENAHRAMMAILEYRKKHQLTIKIFQEATELGTPAAREVIEKLERMVINYIKKKIKEAIKNDDIRPCDPELNAFVIFKLYIALIFDWEKHHDPLQKEDIAEMLKMYILKGLSR